MYIYIDTGPYTVTVWPPQPYRPYMNPKSMCKNGPAPPNIASRAIILHTFGVRHLTYSWGPFFYILLGSNLLHTLGSRYSAVSSLVLDDAEVARAEGDGVQLQERRGYLLKRA